MPSIASATIAANCLSLILTTCPSYYFLRQASLTNASFGKLKKALFLGIVYQAYLKPIGHSVGVPVVAAGRHPLIHDGLELTPDGVAAGYPVGARF